MQRLARHPRESEPESSSPPSASTRPPSPKPPKVKGREERERLRKAAEQAHAGRFSHIDELADSFAEIEAPAGPHSSFDEPKAFSSPVEVRPADSR